MASKTFNIRTEPHDATIGDKVLWFQPEVDGADFATEYAKLREAQADISDGESPDPAAVVAANEAAREFIASFMLPDSKAEFETMRVPDRVLVEVLNWLAELYGAGTGERPTGRSSGSSRSSKTTGTRGSASSPSQG